ncbi:MAG: HD domain-containing phosphohydrolase [Phycisphaerae bacterium]
MAAAKKTNRRVFEVILLLIVLAMTSLLIEMEEHKMVILYLFFLPVVLSGYFLGRTTSGLLALFSAISVTIVLTTTSTGFATYSSPIIVGLAITVWAAVLGLTALLVGTLCDERAAKIVELHTAYVGVVEVLARYLQSANPRAKARSIRVAELCQAVAEKMRLSQKLTDDIRVGALLYDIGSVEITTKLINRAVGTLEAGANQGGEHTFHGRELVHSLEPILSGAVPLLVNQDDAVHDCLTDEDGVAPHDIPLGAKIIRAVRAYDALTEDNTLGSGLGPAEAVKALRKELSAHHDDDVLGALEKSVARLSPAPRHAENVPAR